MHAGDASTIGLKNDGKLWSFGSNFYGDLGLNEIGRASCRERV
jgi:alpha-tubulin suppressor-like RCC1 family protein